MPKAKRIPVDGDLFFIPFHDWHKSFVMVKSNEYVVLCSTHDLPAHNKRNLQGYTGVRYLGNIKDFFVPQVANISAHIRSIDSDEWKLDLGGGT